MITDSVTKVARQPSNSVEAESGDVASRLPRLAEANRIVIARVNSVGSSQRDSTTSEPTMPPAKPRPIRNRPATRRPSECAAANRIEPITAKISIPDTTRRGP